jgi:hypothetical protein
VDFFDFLDAMRGFFSFLGWSVSANALVGSLLFIAGACWGGSAAVTGGCDIPAFFVASGFETGLVA